LTLNIKEIIGIWDVDRAETKLGTFLIYLAELSLLREIYKGSKLEVIIQMRNQNLSLPYLTTLIQFLPNVDSICFNNNIKKYNKNDLSYFWPEKDLIEGTSYSESMQALNKL